jgi:NADH:ubiquinone oxidoreductase subunit 5 (subunit L)/multisubunit Na+/H+ antiporter MnhA subunit
MRKTPVVLGVLSMVFGGLQLLISGAGLATTPFSKQMIGSMGKAFSGLPRQPGQPDVGDMFEKLGKLTEELKIYTYLTAAVMLVLSIALILIGWLLYKRRMQSRKLAVAWAIAALAYLPVQLWVQVKIIQPRANEITRSMLEGMPNASAGLYDSVASFQGTMTVVIYILFYTPFPVLLLWLMGRASAKNDLVAVP